MWRSPPNRSHLAQAGRHLAQALKDPRPEPLPDGAILDLLDHRDMSRTELPDLVARLPGGLDDWPATCLPRARILGAPRRILRSSMATTPEHQPSIAPIVGPDDPRRFTDSGIEVKHEYDAEDVGPGLEERLGEAGSCPFTRGIHPDMYRGRKWTMRQYAGYASAKETNERFHYLIENGSTGLSKRSTCPPSSVATRTIRSAWARSAAPASPSTRSRTCGGCSTASRSTRSRPR